MLGNLQGYYCLSYILRELVLRELVHALYIEVTLADDNGTTQERQGTSDRRCPPW